MFTYEYDWINGMQSQRFIIVTGTIIEKDCLIIFKSKQPRTLVIEFTRVSSQHSVAD